MADNMKEIRAQSELKLSDEQREELAKAFGKEVALKIDSIRLVGIGDSVQSVLVLN